MEEIWSNALVHSFCEKGTLLIFGRLPNGWVCRLCVWNPNKFSKNFLQILGEEMPHQCLCLKMKEEKKLLMWREYRPYLIWEQKFSSVYWSPTPIDFNQLQFHSSKDLWQDRNLNFTNSIKGDQGFHTEFNTLGAETVSGHCRVLNDSLGLVNFVFPVGGKVLKCMYVCRYVVAGTRK